MSKFGAFALAAIVLILPAIAQGAGGPVYDVTSFGARCDGATDDAAAFAKTEEALPPSGGTIQLPAGNCVLQREFVISKHGVILKGAGTFATVLSFPSSSGILISSSYPDNSYGGGLSNIVLEDFSVIGSSCRCDGIIFGEDPSNYTLASDTVRGVWVSGFKNGAGFRYVKAVGTLLDRISAVGNLYGIWLDRARSDGATSLTVTNSAVRMNLNYGVYGTGITQFNLENSVIESNRKEGIYYDHARGYINAYWNLANDWIEANNQGRAGGPWCETTWTGDNEAIAAIYGTMQNVRFNPSGANLSICAHNQADYMHVRGGNVGTKAGTVTLDSGSQGWVFEDVQNLTADASTLTSPYPSNIIIDYAPSYGTMRVSSSVHVGAIVSYPPVAALASASTIAPTTGIVKVSGSATITTITVPASCKQTCQITLIPTGRFTTATGGNISLSSAAVVGKALIMTWDGARWNPSY